MKKIITTLTIISALSIISVFLVIFLVPTKTKFIKPPFDKNSIKGFPEVSNNLGYQEFQVGESYVVFLCGKVYKTNNKLTLYFTSIKENDVYVKLKIYKNDKEIAETGLIKPGEYIKEVNLNKRVKKGDEIVIKVMSYEKDTYYSMGVVTLNTTVL